MHRNISKYRFSFAAGLIEDVQRKIPWYKSDFTDAFHVQVRFTCEGLIYMYMSGLQVHE